VEQMLPPTGNVGSASVGSMTWARRFRGWQPGRDAQYVAVSRSACRQRLGDGSIGVEAGTNCVNITKTM